jgi:thiosulfate dehydrogenase
LAPALAVLFALGGCSPEPALQRGTELFSQTSFSASPSNYFSCSTCHFTTATGDNRILPGATMFDVASRPSWWGGQFDDLFDAVNYCYVEFMRGDPLTRDDVDGRALLVYLESLSPDATSPALPLTTVKNIAASCSMPGEDPICGPTQECKPYTDASGVMRFFCDIDNGADWATTGADLFQRGCANCHGALHSGDGRLGPTVSLITDESISNHGTAPVTGARAITIEKIRHGKFFMVGGNMAPYGLEYLTDAQVGEILGYMFNGQED